MGLRFGQSALYPVSLGVVLSLTVPNLASQTSPPASAFQFIAPRVLFSQPDNVYAVGDLNRDGKMDVLLYNRAELLTNNGNGTFTASKAAIPPLLTNSGGVSQIALVDVNGDGILDLIASESGPSDFYGLVNVGSVAVYLARSDGTFSSTPSFTGDTGAVPISLLTPDLNGDGKPDIVIASQPDSNGPNDLPGGAAIFLNQGSGNFKAIPPYYSITAVVASGDFNHDGKMDLIAAVGNSTQILLGKGDGTFSFGPVLLNQGAWAATAGDFNRDGHLDVAVGLRTQAIVMLGDGAGNFHQSASLNPEDGKDLRGANLQAVLTADLNHDAFPDIALVLGDRIATYFGNGTGGFTFNRIYSANLQGGILHDFNGDGNPDILSSGTELFLGNRNGIFSAAITSFPNISPGPHSAFSVATRDFNGDNISDVAFTSATIPTNGGLANRGYVSIMLGTGKGYLSPAVNYPIAMAGGSIAVGDVNGDGVMDLVIARSGQTYYSNNPPAFDTEVLFGRGDGTFDPPMGSNVLGAPRFNPSNNSVFLADENHDHKLDLIGDWGVALGNGDGTFQTPIHFPSGILNIRDIVAGDLNGDGLTDLVVTGSDVYYSWSLKALGDGHFLIQGHNLPTGQANALIDLNHDGKADLVAASGNIVTVALGRGDGTFRTPTTYKLPDSAAASLVIDDFNRDGKPDIAVAMAVEFVGPSYPGIVVLRGNGDGTFQTPDPVYADGFSPRLSSNFMQIATDLGQVLVPLDLNADGFPDVVDISDAGIDRLINTRRK